MAIYAVSVRFRTAPMAPRMQQDSSHLSAFAPSMRNKTRHPDRERSRFAPPVRRSGREDETESAQGFSHGLRSAL
jgi:hypothetical protein